MDLTPYAKIIRDEEVNIYKEGHPRNPIHIL